MISTWIHLCLLSISSLWICSQIPLVSVGAACLYMEEKTPQSFLTCSRAITLNRVHFRDAVVGYNVWVLAAEQMIIYGIDHLKENRKFSPKLTHRQPNSVSSENHVSQKTFQKAEETALNICTRQHKVGARTMASKCKCGTWARIPVPHSDFIVESS